MTGDRSTEIAALIARLEKATGPDRQLDRMIEETKPGVRKHFDRRMVADAYVLESNGVQAYLPAHYTASLDAALTLLPEGMGWRCEDCERGGNRWIGAWVAGPDAGSSMCNAPTIWRAATPAIALCIAALKAHASFSDVGHRTCLAETTEGMVR